jgi:xanthine dehydrogenase accessory factor
MNLETAKAALSLLEAGEGFALATILSSLGSSPRHADTSMLVRADSSIAGTIGGGALEATVIKDCLSVLESRNARLVDFDTAGLGMMCGGKALVLFEHVDPVNPAALELYRGLRDLFAGGRKGWVVTAIQETEGGKLNVGRCLVAADGSIYGDRVRSPDALQELARRGGTYDVIVSGDPSKTHVQAVGAQGTAYVFGAGHCGEKLIPVLSSVGFFTVIVDDRSDFANRERFPTADRIVVPESFDGAMAALPVDKESYIVIVTRGHAYDKSVLAQALRTEAGYVGMIGSKKKVTQTLDALRAESFSAPDIARVHAPIGLPIGGETPEEIAVSIAAQMIQVRAGKAAEATAAS